MYTPPVFLYKQQVSSKYLFENITVEDSVYMEIYYYI